MGFHPGDAQELNRSMSELVLSEVRRTFNPEFINRIDEIIVFEPLVDEDLQRILLLLLDQMNANLVDRRLTIRLAPEAVDWIIATTCRDRSYGARPLRRALQRYVEDPLSEELIRGHLRSGDVEVYLDGEVLRHRPVGTGGPGRPLA
jgi:ATP-dependent Clp protease ATP-binding subunit ClpC